MIYIGTIILTLVLARLSWLDLRTFRLPDFYTLPLILAGLILAAGQDGIGLTASLAGCLLGYALFWGVGQYYFWRKGREGLGLGDAKLFAASGAWLGVALLPHVLLIAAVGGLVVSLLRPPTSGREIAFGPWLALGFWLVWMVVHIVKINPFG